MSGSDPAQDGSRIVILAAGSSRRLGQAKQTLPWKGSNLLQHTADTAAAVRQPVWITLGAEAETCWQSLRSNRGLQRIDVPLHAEGMAASLRAAAALATAQTDVQRLLVLLVDQHAVDAAWLSQLLQLAAAHPQHMIASCHGGLRGAPAVFPRRSFATLAQLQGDRGARDLLRAAAADQVIDYPAPHPPGDLDTRTDLMRTQALRH